VSAAATNLEAALALAGRGFAVFPLRPRGKQPLIAKADGGHGVKDATTDPVRIVAWLRREPLAGIGLACGAPSGIFAVDDDPAKGGDETLAELELRHGPLPSTPVSLTGGGGRHFLFQHATGIGNRVHVAAGIDIRGDGGYIVAPPSLHPCGRPYAWSVDHHIDDVPIAAAPAWLIELVRQPKAGAAHAAEFWREAAGNGVDEGQRNDMATKLTGHLLRRWIDPEVVLELMLCWNAVRCRPPLAPSEIETIVKSIWTREQQRRGERYGR
jgi:hypothetical protein